MSPTNGRSLSTAAGPGYLQVGFTPSPLPKVPLCYHLTNIRLNSGKFSVAKLPLGYAISTLVPHGGPVSQSQG